MKIKICEVFAIEEALKRYLNARASKSSHCCDVADYFATTGSMSKNFQKCSNVPSSNPFYDHCNALLNLSIKAVNGRIIAYSSDICSEK